MLEYRTCPGARIPWRRLPRKSCGRSKRVACLPRRPGTEYRRHCLEYRVATSRTSGLGREAGRDEALRPIRRITVRHIRTLADHRSSAGDPVTRTLEIATAAPSL